MRSTRPLVMALVVALSVVTLFTPTALAASAILDPPVPETSLLDLTAGGSINFVGSVTTPAGEAPSNVQIGMEFGGTLAYAESMAPPEGTSLIFSITVSTDAIIANCSSGSFSYRYFDTMSGASTGTNSVECSSAVVVEPPTVVTPVLPTVQTDVCGPANDVITIPAQPVGIITNDPGWAGNTRTVYFTVEPGYVSDGVAVANFVDSDTPCDGELPAAPSLTLNGVAANATLNVGETAYFRTDPAATIYLFDGADCSGSPFASVIYEGSNSPTIPVTYSAMAGLTAYPELQSACLVATWIAPAAPSPTPSPTSTESPPATTPAPTETSEPVVPPVQPPAAQPVVPAPDPVQAAPAGVVTTLPNTGSGSADMALTLTLGGLALLAMIGVTGLYRFTHR